MAFGRLAPLNKTLYIACRFELLVQAKVLDQICQQVLSVLIRFRSQILRLKLLFSLFFGGVGRVGGLRRHESNEVVSKQ